MERFPRGRTAIVGAAIYGLGEAPGYESIDLAAHASMVALEDAGLKLGDVDAPFICLPSDMLSGLSFAEYLGMETKLTDNNRTGGSAFLTHTTMAALALEAGLCDVALIAYGSNQRSGAGKLVGALNRSIYEDPYNLPVPISAYALAAARHMHQYGTTRAQLAEVAVAARGWARKNPEAYMRDELTLEQVLAARMVCDPLSVRDCCLVTDGAGAIVMTRADRAKDLRKAPVHLLGAGQAVTHKEITSMADFTVTGALQSGRSAYATAKVSAADIDLVQLYDAFTINTILFLEDLGFCPKGEGGRFVVFRCRRAATARLPFCCPIALQP